VPLYVVQIVLAALPSLNANPYIIFQYFSSFFSVICVAFATSTCSPLSLPVSYADMPGA
jgi:hypothetical protein